MSRLFLVLCFFCSSLFSQTIEEKKAQGFQLKDEGEAKLDLHIDVVNQKISQLRQLLSEEMKQADAMQKAGATDEEYQCLLESVQIIKREMVTLQERWRQSAVGESKREEEGYGLWDQEETTLPSLVMEYGASEYLYIVPNELANMKMTMHSNIPIPRETWSEVLEIILSHNGIGVKSINPFTRQLYVLKQDPAAVVAIASKPEDIRFIQDERRIFYVFSPPVEHVKSAFQFFERFSDPKMTFVYNIGGKVAIVSTKEEIEKLIQLYHAVWQDPQRRGVHSPD